jgi:hypothetical protein
MRRVSARGPIKLSRHRRLWVYGISLGLWLSGAIWLVLHYFLRTKGEFGPETNPAEPWALKAHAAFAFGTLWLLGLLWGVHVLNGWHANRRRWSGGALLGLMVALGLTGYLLYYAGDDDVRRVVSAAHWVLGLGAPVLFLLHRLAREAGRMRSTPLRPRERARVGAE